MPSPADGQSVRRSQRLRGAKPEFEPFEDPERTPKKHLVPGADFPKTDAIRELRNRGVSEKIKRTDSSSPDQSESNHTNYGNINYLERRYVNNFGQSQDEMTGERICVSVRSAPLSQRRECNISSNTHDSNCKLYLLVTFLVVMIAIIFSVIPFISVTSKDPKNEIDLQVQFPQQSKELWGFISHGMNSDEPFVLLLVHANEENVATRLAKHIAKIVASARTKKSVNALVVDGKGEVDRDTFVKLRPQLIEGMSLVLLHVENMTANAAEFLHFVLDVHEPWIPGGVYVLTLNMPYIDINKKNSLNDVQTFLKKKWSGSIEEDSLDALITRICNFEYVVKTDNSSH